MFVWCIGFIGCIEFGFTIQGKGFLLRQWEIKEESFGVEEAICQELSHSHLPNSQSPSKPT